MKKITLLAVFFCLTQIAAAQDKTIVIKKDSTTVKADLYFGAGAVFNSGYNINNKLKSSGLPELGDVAPEFSAGLNVVVNKISADIEYNFSYLKKDNNPLRYTMVGSTFKLRGHYIVVQKRRFMVSGGLDLSYTRNNFDLFNRNDDIDLDDLDPGSQTGHISLYNDLFYVGPSVAVGLVKNNSYRLRLNMGYEVAFTRGKWKSDYTDVLNTVGESGHDRFYVRLTLH